MTERKGPPLEDQYRAALAALAIERGGEFVVTLNDEAQIRGGTLMSRIEPDHKRHAMTIRFRWVPEGQRQ